MSVTQDKVSIQIDDEFQSIIPSLTPEEFSTLESNIIADGCRDPIVLWGALLIDGHNRFSICQKHELPYPTTQKAFASRDEATLWIIINQFGRRNLTPYQRAELALRLRPVIEAKAKAKQVAGGEEKVPQKSAEPIETRKEIARIAGVSHDTIYKAGIIAEKASDETKQLLRQGDTTINREFKELANPHVSHNSGESAAGQTAGSRTSFGLIRPNETWLTPLATFLKGLET